MIEVSNLRKYSKDRGYTRLEADLTFSEVGVSPYAERTLYFSVKNEHAAMLDDSSYDAFVLIPLYLAMYHKTALKIRGRISKKLHNNVRWYIQKILCDFSDDLSPVDFIVEGFAPPAYLCVQNSSARVFLAG